jgi:hypothetical protein
VTAALVAGAANWLIIRHHVRRLAAVASRESGAPAAASGRSPAATGPQARASGPLPALIVDETDDAGGHRIHVNPWADEPAD